jgi:hypothetical protein
MQRRDFDALYREVADLCRTLGSDLPGDKTTLPSPAPRQAA